jgi:hypothetical protein
MIFRCSQTPEDNFSDYKYQMNPNDHLPNLNMFFSQFPNHSITVAAVIKKYLLQSIRPEDADRAEARKPPCSIKMR